MPGTDVVLASPYRRGQAWMYERLVAGAVRDALGDVLDRQLLAHLPIGGTLLDVGAGGGTVTRLVLARRPDLNVVAIEPSAAMRALAADALAGLPVTLRAGTAEELGVPDGTAHGVLSAGAIKHWPDRAAGIAACLRALVPGGRILVTELDRACRAEDVRAFVARWPAPSFLRPLLRANLRAVVARHSIDLEDARALAAGLVDPVMGRIPGAPLVFFAGCAP